MTLPSEPGTPVPATEADPQAPVETEVVEVVEITEEQAATDDDQGYEPDTTTEPDEVTEDDELPPGDSGEFDGASMDEEESAGEAQPDEPMTREAEQQEQE